MITKALVAVVLGLIVLFIALSVNNMTRQTAKDAEQFTIAPCKGKTIVQFQNTMQKALNERNYRTFAKEYVDYKNCFPKRQAQLQRDYLALGEAIVQYEKGKEEYFNLLDTYLDEHVTDSDAEDKMNILFMMTEYMISQQAGNERREAISKMLSFAKNNFEEHKTKDAAYIILFYEAKYHFRSVEANMVDRSYVNQLIEKLDLLFSEYNLEQRSYQYAQEAHGLYDIVCGRLGKNYDSRAHKCVERQN